MEVAEFRETSEFSFYFDREVVFSGFQFRERFRKRSRIRLNGSVFRYGEGLAYHGLDGEAVVSVESVRGDYRLATVVRMVGRVYGGGADRFSLRLVPESGEGAFDYPFGFRFGFETF